MIIHFPKRTFKSIYLFLLILGSTNLSAQEGGNFELTVAIEGMPDEIITITYLNLEGQKEAVVKTAVNGIAHFTGTTLHPTWARFNGKKSKANGAFFLESGTIELNLASQFPYLREVKGSQLHEEYNTYRSSRKDLKVKSDSLYAIARPLASKKDKTFKEEQYRQKLFGIISDLTEEKKLDYIATHPDSYLSLSFARGLYNYDPKVAQLENVYGLLSKNMKQKELGKQLYAYLEKTRIVGIDQILPNFTLPDRNNKNKSLSDFRGKFVLVDFWYSGCPPCIAQFPKLIELHTANKHNFEIVGVSHDGTKYRDKWIKVLDNKKTTWTQLLDLTNEVCDQFGIEAFPSNFLLNREGVIVAKNISEHQLEAFLTKNIN